MSQMSTETIIEIETVVDDLTAYEFDIVCYHKWWDRPCEEPARWSALKTCCGQATFLCDACKEHFLTTEEGSRCGQCMTTHVPARAMVFNFGPLSRA